MLFILRKMRRVLKIFEQKCSEMLFHTEKSKINFQLTEDLRKLPAQEAGKEASGPVWSR